MLAPPPSRSILVAPLALREAAQALALVRLERDDLSTTAWASFLDAWRTNPGSARGLLSATSRRGAVLGLAPWWQQPGLSGDSLWAGPNWVCEPVGGTLVADALEQALAATAKDRACGRLVIVLKDALRERAIPHA